jgi:uncharacterized protein
MNAMKTVLTCIKVLAISYCLICIVLYFVQERLLFYPQQLPADYVFHFNLPFEECAFTTADQTTLHGLLFKADSSRGLIFYLHGNAGSLASWGSIAKTYTNLHYDLFMLDYRGYGKSGSRISSEQQFYDDVELVYDSLLKRYDENEVVVLGYSIGTGAAARLAAFHHPKMLILQAPYYSLARLVNHYFYVLPPFILKYQFKTNKWLALCKMPVTLFHGDRDEVIYYGSSVQLAKQFKRSDTLITLQGQGHNNMSEHPAYPAALGRLLER